MTMKCFAQPATIFSWVRQPLPEKATICCKEPHTTLRYFQSCQGWGNVPCSYPPPLMRVSPASTSSAPSMATSSCYRQTQTNKQTNTNFEKHSWVCVKIVFFPDTCEWEAMCGGWLFSSSPLDAGPGQREWGNAAGLTDAPEEERKRVLWGKGWRTTDFTNMVSHSLHIDIGKLHLPGRR